jgi:hypothetical protein
VLAPGARVRTLCPRLYDAARPTLDFTNYDLCATTQTFAAPSLKDRLTA